MCYQRFGFWFFVMGVWEIGICAIWTLVVASFVAPHFLKYIMFSKHNMQKMFNSCILIHYFFVDVVTFLFVFGGGGG